MVSVLLVEVGFFPLDEQLALLPGNLTPRLQEALVRLSTHIPSFAKASAELAWFTGARVHADTARRRTEDAGRLLLRHESQEVARILQHHPTPPPGPETLLFSVDGAMVPLLHGQWTEVRTLVVGAVQPPSASAAGPLIHTTDLSYFSRRLDSTTFAEQALGELQRRGLETASRVGAVTDGADWCQQFIDLHKPDAVRILDFAHAAEYLTAIGQATDTAGVLLEPTELARLRHDLKHHGPEGVLRELRALVAAHPSLPHLPKHLAYLEKRVAMLQYPHFQADGWPIGSGLVESANKLVVEDRLKGAGMHWTAANVNPMLVLRNALVNKRWEEVWTVIEVSQRQQAVVCRQERRQRHRHRPPVAGAVVSLAAPPTGTTPAPSECVPKNHRPAADHPWRKTWSKQRQREQARFA